MRKIRIDENGFVVIVSGLGAGRLIACPLQRDTCSTDCAAMDRPAPWGDLGDRLACRALHGVPDLGELEADSEDGGEAVPRG